MNNTIKKSLLIFTLILPSYSGHAETTNVWDDYETIATNISKSVFTAPLDTLAMKSKKLAYTSIKLLPSFVKKQPICKVYLETAINAIGEMLAGTLEDIEKNYHADGKLPPVQAAECYHAKDLLVHPATIAVIANTQEDSQQTREAISHELEEVLEHFKQVKLKATH